MRRHKSSSAGSGDRANPRWAPLDHRYVRRSRAPLLIGGGVLSLLILLSIVMGRSSDRPPNLTQVSATSFVSDGRDSCLYVWSKPETGVNSVMTVDASVDFGSCLTDELFFERMAAVQPEIPSDSAPVFAEGRARMALEAPLFTGEIREISNQDQPVGPSSIAPARWAWQVKPLQPGEFELSLVLTIFEPDADTVELQNERRIVPIRSVGSPEYYIGAFLKASGEFFTSIQGILVSLTAIGAAASGGYFKLRKKHAVDEEPSIRLEREKQDGYL